MKPAFSHTTLILRMGLGFVILWFGVSQFLDPLYWSSYVPGWTAAFGLSGIQVVLLNALFETVLGALLVLGIYVRIAAILLFLHLVLIIADLGFNEIGVRDFGLAAALLALAWSRDLDPA